MGEHRLQLPQLFRCECGPVPTLLLARIEDVTVKVYVSNGHIVLWIWGTVWSPQVRMVVMMVERRWEEGVVGEGGG